MFFEEGKKLASGSEDEMGIVYIWEQTKIKFQVKQKIKTGLSLVDQIAVSPDNRYIIAVKLIFFIIYIIFKKNLNIGQFRRNADLD